MLDLFAASLCAQFIDNGHRVLPYWKCTETGRAFWAGKAAEVLPGVLAALLWR